MRSQNQAAHKYATTHKANVAGTLRSRAFVVRSCCKKRCRTCAGLRKRSARKTLISLACFSCLRCCVCARNAAICNVKCLPGSQRAVVRLLVRGFAAPRALRAHVFLWTNCRTDSCVLLRTNFALVNSICGFGLQNTISSFQLCSKKSSCCYGLFAKTFAKTFAKIIRDKIRQKVRQIESLIYSRIVLLLRNNTKANNLVLREFTAANIGAVDCAQCINCGDTNTYSLAEYS